MSLSETTALLTSPTTSPTTPLTAPEIQKICTTTSRALSNLHRTLPHFESLLSESQHDKSDPSAISTRRLHFSLFNNLVSRLEGVHSRNCTKEGKVGTREEFDEVMLVMPFHSLLEVAVRREVEFDRREGEFLERERGLVEALRVMKGQGGKQSDANHAESQD